MIQVAFGILLLLSLTMSLAFGQKLSTQCISNFRARFKRKNIGYTDISRAFLIGVCSSQSFSAKIYFPRGDETIDGVFLAGEYS